MPFKFITDQQMRLYMTDKKGYLRYDEVQIRQVRRHLKKGFAVCEAVSKGEFPGKARL